MCVDVFKVLEDRGYIYQATNIDQIKEILKGNKKITFYLGIDPTADSLHIGHFFALMMFRYLQDAGHKGILVIGGATALIGDPSCKSDMRKMLTKEQVKHNLEEVKALAKRFVRTDGDNPAIILNNADWLNDTYVDFMRRIGVHFNVNKMLAAESYANRLKNGGLTFLEMGYMLMQAYDFVYLNNQYGCSLQIGGSDQWGNIVAGLTLNRKLNNLNDEDNNERDLLGLTCPLLLTKDGKKMGKTENGTLWVAREKTTCYDFYQYFYNVQDSDVEMLLKLFTRLPLERIKNLIEQDIILAKRTMAYEITKLVHGAEETNKVVESLSNLFGKGSMNNDSMPTKKILLETMEISVLDLVLLSDFVGSKSEIRRLVAQGGLYINNDRVLDANEIIDIKQLENSEIILKKGKKTFLRVILCGDKS